MADIGSTAVDDVVSAADYVRPRRHRFNRSNVEFLCDLDRIVALDAEIHHCALDLRVPEQEADCPRYGFADKSARHSCDAAKACRTWTDRARCSPPLLNQLNVLPRIHPPRSPRLANKNSSVSSNRTGRPVFFWRVVARHIEYPIGATSSTRTATASQPLRDFSSRSGDSF